MLKSCKKKIINLENVLEEVYGEYNVRETARAIILDSQNKIAMIHVSKNNYYQLVGGGIERGESVGGGLKRECLEEAGVEIELLDKLCDVKEVGYFAKQIQNSYCYVARVVGEKGETKFTQDESGLYGLKSVWMEFEEIFKIMKEKGFSNQMGEYVYTRNMFVFGEFGKVKEKYYSKN